MPLYEQSHAALEDWRDIVEYTLDNFGVDQTEKYTSGLLQCIEKMAKGQGHTLKRLKCIIEEYGLSTVRSTTFSDWFVPIIRL